MDEAHGPAIEDILAALFAQVPDEKWAKLAGGLDVQLAEMKAHKDQLCRELVEIRDKRDRLQSQVASLAAENERLRAELGVMHRCPDCGLRTDRPLLCDGCGQQLCLDCYGSLHHDHEEKPCPSLSQQ